MSGRFGTAAWISGEYIASTRVGGSWKRPAVLTRTTYSTLVSPCGSLHCANSTFDDGAFCAASTAPIPECSTGVSTACWQNQVVACDPTGYVQSVVQPCGDRTCVDTPDCGPLCVLDAAGTGIFDFAVLEFVSHRVERRHQRHLHRHTTAVAGDRMTARQIHLAAHFPGVNSTTVWTDPQSGSQIDFESFAHMARTAERRFLLELRQAEVGGGPCLCRIHVGLHFRVT